MTRPMNTRTATLLAAALAFHSPAALATNAPILHSKITSVTFSGSGYSHLTDDEGNPYDIPQWRRDEPPAGPPYYYNRSVSYEKNTIPVIGATFEIEGLTSDNNTVAISAEGTDGIGLPEKNVTVNNGVAVYPATPATKPWPDAIKFYDRNPETPDSPAPFTLTWKVQQNSNAFIESTNHQVYVTLVKPALAKNRETLFYLACHNPSGMDGSNLIKVVNSIYGEFSDREIQRINPKTGNPEGLFLRYYGKGFDFDGTPWDEETNPKPSDEHILAQGTGVCGAWSEFLVEVLSVHVIIEAKTVGVIPTFSPSVNPKANGAVSREFVLKPVPVDPDGENVELDDASGEPVNYKDVRIPAQGRSDGRVSWSAHAITRFTEENGNSYYYDPSYGTGPFDEGLPPSPFALLNYARSMAGFCDQQSRLWPPDNSAPDIKINPDDLKTE